MTNRLNGDNANWTSENPASADMNDTFGSVVSNTIAATETMIQATKVSADATVTDITRTNAQVDVFSDSGGYNNTLNTGSSTALYDATNDYYTCQDGGTTETETAGGTSTTDTDHTVTLTVNQLSYFNQVKFVTNGNCTWDVTIAISGTGTVATDSGAAGGAETVTSTFVFSDYSAIFADGDTVTVRIEVTDNINVTAAAAYDGTIFDHTSQVTPTTDWVTFTSIVYSNSILLTTSSTKASNIASCLVNAETTTPTDTSITVDVSTDGGSVYDVSGQSLRSVLALDNDDTDLVLRFNLVTTNDDATPTISSYAVQLFKGG